MPTSPSSIVAPGLSPDPTDRGTYNGRSYAWMAWLKDHGVPEIYASALNAYNNAVEAAASAAGAVASALAAAASATSAAATAGAVAFNPATSYAQYASAIGADMQTYRRNAAGTSATDPSLDPANWTPITGAPGTVIAPTLINSWSNYGSVYAPAGFWKDSFGVVHLRGMLTGGTIGATAFVLPAGYRPATNKYEYFPAASNSAFGAVQVDSNGGVTLQTGSSAWFSLSGISFRTA